MVDSDRLDQNTLLFKKEKETKSIVLSDGQKKVWPCNIFEKGKFLIFSVCNRTPYMDKALQNGITRNYSNAC